MAQNITSVIFFIVSAMCVFYGIRAWNYKGPILMNKYLLASDEEKAMLKRQPESEKKADYRYAAKLSFGIAAAAFFCALGILVRMFFTWTGIAVLAVLVIYALTELFRGNRN